MTERRVPIWLYFSIALTAALAGVSMWQRYQAEGKNHAVGLVTEIETVQLLASSQGVSLEDALKKLKEKGLTGVVLSEETIGDLVADGRVRVVPESVEPQVPDLTVRQRVARGLANRFEVLVAPTNPADPNPDMMIGLGTLNPILARGASVGLDPLMANQARTLNLDIIARLGNPLGATEKYVRESIKWAAENGATIFLPQGEQVLGRRDSMDALADELGKQKMFYATPEFAKIGGDDAVVGKIPDRIIRLHSAQTQELDKLSPAEAIERYGKAAAERNQRLLLLRPFTSASAQPVDSFGDFVGKVRSQIEREGYKAGTPHPFEDSGVPMPIFVLIAVSTLPVSFWLAMTVFPGTKARSARTLPVVWAGLGLITLLAVATVLPAARGPFALLCTLAYPTMAFMLLDLSPVGIFPGYLRTSAISLVGGFCVAGLLNGLPFFVKADAFAGVKVAHFLPIGLIGFYFLSRKTKIREALRTPMFWQQAILAIVIVAGFAFMNSRTGNDNPAGVSGVELKFRALMDQFMYVRPRTKEFLIGNPAMIVALGMLASKRSYGAWIALAMMIGAIGQTSMINTMCHLHTPLTVSLSRIGVGWVLGGILGAMVWGGLSRIPARGQN